MSVVACIIETQTDKEKEMENRYAFGGFTFGADKLFQLTIRQLKENGYGYAMGVELELTQAERQELITILTTMNEKDNA